METADAFLSEGLKDASYEYVVVDDHWEADERIDGRLTWDSDKFPSGIPALADYVHGKGLKFGIYSCAGSQTCGGKPASYGYEEIDAQTFAEWGVDFLKYDFCYVPPGVNGPTLYQRMGQALRATGRPIVFSVCEWGTQKPWEWAGRVGGHMWRTTGDIGDWWESIVRIGFEQQVGLEAYAGPGRWNDPDMLVVGMYGEGVAATLLASWVNYMGKVGCTDAEYRSHFSLWCLLAAPLMIGCDVRKMNQATRDVLLNREVIAIDQDPLGRQGYRVGRVLHGDQPADVWAKPLEDGSVVVGLFNLTDYQGGAPWCGWRHVTVAWESVGLHDRCPCLVRDLWAHEDLGVFTREFTARVDSHDVMLVRITPQS